VCAAGSGYITEHGGIRRIIEFVKELAKGDLSPLLLRCDAVAPPQSRGSAAYCIARPVTGLSRKRVNVVAAAKHHTVIATCTGELFTWGSNRGMFDSS
jgi:hypothetical protein